MVDCPLDHKDNYYSINFQAFEEELKNGVEAVVICNPHNPIGRVWTDGEMEHIVDLCVEYGVYLLSDEIHADFGMTRPYTTAGRFEKSMTGWWFTQLSARPLTWPGWGPPV